jgi:hypothetical protein
MKCCEHVPAHPTPLLHVDIIAKRGRVMLFHLHASKPYPVQSFDKTPCGNPETLKTLSKSRWTYREGFTGSELVVMKRCDHVHAHPAQLLSVCLTRKHLNIIPQPPTRKSTLRKPQTPTHKSPEYRMRGCRKGFTGSELVVMKRCDHVHAHPAPLVYVDDVTACLVLLHPGQHRVRHLLVRVRLHHLYAYKALSNVTIGHVVPPRRAPHATSVRPGMSPPPVCVQST